MNKRVVILAPFFLFSLFITNYLYPKDNKVFDNVRSINFLLGRNLLISENMTIGQNAIISGNLGVTGSTTINGSLVVNGQISGPGAGFVKTQLPVSANQIARFTDNTGLEIKGSQVSIDNSGNIAGANNIELAGITKNGNTVSWPNIVGAANTFLGSDGAGNLVYGTPAGAGNVSSALNFTTDNAILVTDLASGVKNIKQTNILITANDISGIGNISANSANISGNLTSGSINSGVTTVSTLNASAVNSDTGDFTGDVNVKNLIASQDVSASTADITGLLTAGSISATNGAFTGNLGVNNLNVSTANITTLTVTNAYISNASLSGDITANNITALNQLSGASGNISGTLAAGTVNATSGTITTLGGTTGNFSGNLTGGNLISNGNVTASSGTVSSNAISANTGSLATSLTMLNQAPIRFNDFTNSNYVGIRAPATASSSYTVDLPTTAPSAWQFLQANQSTPLQTQWATFGGGSPSQTKILYVSVVGNDSNNGSIYAPFKTVSAALALANTISTQYTPVEINVGPGIFAESPLTVTADGISIVGQTILATTIMATAPGTKLINVQSPYFSISNLTLAGIGTAPGSMGLYMGTTDRGRINISSILVYFFQYGIYVETLSGLFPTIFLSTPQFAGNSTCLYASNAVIYLDAGEFRGPLGVVPANTGMVLTGTTTIGYIADSNFDAFNTVATVSNGAHLHLLAALVNNSNNGIVCQTGSKSQLVGCNFAFNNAASINIDASGQSAGIPTVPTQVYVEATLFDGKDSSGNPQGTCIKVYNGAQAFLSHITIDSAAIAVQGGNASFPVPPYLNSNISISSGVIKNSTLDLVQLDSSTITLKSGGFDSSKVVLNDPTTVLMSAFDADGTLSFGNTLNAETNMFKLATGQTYAPITKYNPSYYGNAGQIFINQNDVPSCSGTQSNQNDASYYLVTGDINNTAKINFIADSGTLANSANTRGWEISKVAATDNSKLAFSFYDSDLVPGVGQNSVMKLNGYDNQVEFPASTTSPLPTYTVARLVWAGDTNLYRFDTGKLKTDSNLIIGTGSNLTVPAGLASNPSIIFPTSTNTGIYSSSANNISFTNAGTQSMNINSSGNVSVTTLAQPSGGVVHSDSSGVLSSSKIVNSDITVGTIQNDRLATTVTSSNTPNSIVLRDASGNFNAHTITASGAAPNGFVATGAGNGFWANSGALFNGDLNGNATTATTATTYFSGTLGTSPTTDVTGTQASLSVVKVGGTTAAIVGSGSQAAYDATDIAPYAGKIVKRDALGNFSAGTITANLTGAASLNVLKTGDTMSGVLNMGANAGVQKGINFWDKNNTRYIGIQAPDTTSSDYIINLPAISPLSGQSLLVTSSYTPYSTAWTTLSGGSPATTYNIYVSKGGSDTNDGSLTAPFATVAKAVTVANTLASLSTRVAINIGAGTFNESNPINITADGISIVGSSVSATFITPTNPAADLFYSTSSNVAFFLLSLAGAGMPTSTASGLTVSSSNPGFIIFDIFGIQSFDTGLSLLHTTTAVVSPIIFMGHSSFAGCTTCIDITNIETVIKNSFFMGPSEISTPPYTAIKLGGPSTHAHVTDNTFADFDTGIQVTNGAKLYNVSSCTFETNTNSLICDNAKAMILGCNFILNTTSTINITSQNGAKVYVEGCLFDCESELDLPAGTAIKCITASEAILNNSTLDEAVIGILCGQAGDAADTQVIASGVNLRDCVLGVDQYGASTLQFTSGTFNEDAISISDPTNVIISSFDENGSLTFRNGSGQDTPIYKIDTNDAIKPTASYKSNFYGNKGSVYQNPNADDTCSAIVAGSSPATGGDASYYAVTSRSDKQAKIELLADTATIGGIANTRGWKIAKETDANNSNLAFGFYDNDSSPGVGQNNIVKFNGYNNQVEFPASTTSPLPTYTVARLVWAGDTNLYRFDAGKLKTDSSLIIGSGQTLTVPSGLVNAPSIIFPTSTTTGIYSSGVNNISFTNAGVQSANIDPSGLISVTTLAQPTGGVVHSDAFGILTSSKIINSDIAPGTIQDDRLSTTVTNTNTPSTIVKRDSSGDFNVHVITASGTTSGFVASGAGNGFWANSGAQFNGPLNGNATTATTANNVSDQFGSLGGDITGYQTNLTVNTVGGQTAATVAAGSYAASIATDANTAGRIVKRDGSGSFSAQNITAAGTVGAATLTSSGSASANTISATVSVTAPNFYGNATTATDATTATRFSTSLTGDVVGGNWNGSYINTTTVNFVGGTSATNIAQATALALAATENNDANTIVKRDGAGNFEANMITLNTAAILNPNDATTKDYVDTQVNAGGLVPKTPVLVTSTISTNTYGLYTIDGVALNAGDRVLLVGQGLAGPSTAVYNGIWEADPSDWVRPSDFMDTGTAGRAYILTMSGDTMAGSSWLCNTPLAIIGTDDIYFTLFSLPGTTTGQNLGSGSGQVYKDKTGITLNFRTLAALSHMIITTSSDNTVKIGTNATSTASNNTIVARDLSGNFEAGTITANLTGAASQNVLKAGDTMIGDLTMANQKLVKFQDSATGLASIGAPASVGTDYTILLPENLPAMHKYIKATTGTFDNKWTTTWTTIFGTPTETQAIYVAMNGSDTANNGSQDQPFRTVKHALDVANAIANYFYPITINLGTGYFVEDNTGGPLQINAEGISIVGNSIFYSAIVGSSASEDLIQVNVANISVQNLSLVGPGVTGINFNIPGGGLIEFNDITLQGFEIGINAVSPTGAVLILLNNGQFADNGTAMKMENVQASIRSSVLEGTFGTTPVNTGIVITGSSNIISLASTVFRYFETGLSVNGGSLRYTGGNTENNINSILCQNGSQVSVTGLNNLYNWANSDTIVVKDSGTTLFLEGSMFNCADSTTLLPTGTAVTITNGAKLYINSTTIQNAGVGMLCGTPTDTETTAIDANTVNLLHCAVDLMQRGTSGINFVGGTIENIGLVFENPENITLVSFNSQNNTTLSFGNTTDSNQIIYNIQNANPPAATPALEYDKSYYSSKGMVYKNPQTDNTCSGVEAATGNANQFVVTGNNTNAAGLSLYSDSAIPGAYGNVRGWDIQKVGGANAKLTFSYYDDDPTPIRGSNAVMTLNGYDNQVEFPQATNTPLPTNTYAKLVWAGDTNLYRASANTLQTDSNFVVNNTGSNPTLTVPVATYTAPAIIFPTSTSTGIYSSGTNNISFTNSGAQSMNIDSSGNVSINTLGVQQPVSGVVHNTGATGVLSSSKIVNDDITNGTIADNKLVSTITNTNTPNTIVKRDANGDFEAHAITTSGTSPNGFIATGAGNGFWANSGAMFNGDLNGNAATASTATSFSGSLVGDVTGTQGATVVSTVGGKTAASVASATTTVQAATNLATPSTLVMRDGSGNFLANTITASLTGAASLNVLKAGDTMSGILNMGPLTGTRKGIQFLDNAGSSYAGLQAPASVTASYTVDLPSSAPAPGQFLQALTSNILTWTSVDAPPVDTKTYYVTLAGSDSNDGSLSRPYRTVKYAVSQANLVANESNPVTINIGPGFFYEDNTSGPITITADNINIIGSSIASTMLIAMDSTNYDFFDISVPNVEFYDLILISPTIYSTKTGIKIHADTTNTGNGRLTSVGIGYFNVGLELSSTLTSSRPIIIIENLQSQNNNTTVSISNIQSVIKNSILQGTSSEITANTGITVSGVESNFIIESSILRYFDTAINVTSGTMRASAVNLDSCTNGFVFNGSCIGFLTGVNSILNNSSSVNVLAQSGAQVNIEGSQLDCSDEAGNPQGTCIKCITGSNINFRNSAISSAVIGIECGQAGDTLTTNVKAGGAILKSCTTAISQAGSSALQVVGGKVDIDALTIADPTNVTISTFDKSGFLYFGNNSGQDTNVYYINSNEVSKPHLTYKQNFYSSDGTAYMDENADNVFNATIAGNGPGLSGDAGYYVITTDNTKTANLSLHSNTSTPGDWTGVKGWTLSKLGNAGADLVITYTNNDGAAYGPNNIMQFDGVNNQIILPTATSAPGGTPRLVWGASGNNANLYATDANTLVTDGSFKVGAVVANGTLSLPLGSNTNPSLSFAGDINTGMYSSGAEYISFTNNGTKSMEIDGSGNVSVTTLAQPSGGVVHSDASGVLSSSKIVNGDITAGTIQNDRLATTVTSANTPNTIVLRDANGDFVAHSISTSGSSPNGFVTTGAGNGFWANSGALFNGNLNGNATTASSATSFTGSLAGDVSGTQGATIVDYVGNGATSAASITSAVNTVGAATSSSTPLTLAMRDASGGLQICTVYTCTGSASLPSLTFVGDTDTGIYSSGSNGIAITTAGAQQLNITPNLVSLVPVSAQIATPNGSDAVPPYTFSNSTNTGVFSSGSNNLSITANGITQMSFSPQTATLLTGTLTLPAGSYGSPSLQFTGGSGTGICEQVADVLSFDVTGVERANISSTGLNINTGHTLTLPATTAPSTSLNFTGNLTTGLSATGNALSLISNGAERVNISSSGAVSLNTGPLTLPTSVAGTPILNFTGNLTTGISDTGNVLSFNVSAAEKANVSSAGLAVTTGNTLTLPDTAVATPSLRFATSTTTGISATGNALSLISNGAQRVGISSTGAVSLNTGPLTLPTSVAGTPILNFTGNLTTGISDTGNVLSFNVSAAEKANVSSTGLTVTTGNTLTLPATTAPSTSLNFTGNLTTGLSATGNALSLISNGAERINISSTGAVSLNTGPLTLPTSAAGTPILNFTGNLTTGISDTGNVLSFNVSAAEKANVSATGVTLTSGNTLTLPTSTAGTPSLNFTGNTGTGLSDSSNVLSFNVSSAEKGNFSSTGLTMTSGNTITLPTSTAGTPSLNFTGNTGTGLSDTGNVLSFNVSSAEKANVSTTGVTVTTGNTLTLPATTAPTNSLNFTGNTTTGLSATGSVLSLNAGGTQTMGLSSGLITNYLPLCIGGPGTPSAIQVRSAGGGFTVLDTTSILLLNTSGTTYNITMPTGVNGRILTIVNACNNTNPIGITYPGATFLSTNAVTTLDANGALGTTSARTSVTYMYTTQGAISGWVRIAYC